jgi:hypothetical protein
LFALAVQFALAFGHVHVAGTNKGAPSLLVQLLTPAPSATPDDAAKPAKPAKSQTAHEQCAVCASIRLVSGVIPGVAPSFQLPADARPTWFAVNIDLALATSSQNSFQARAPPQA